MLKDMTADQVWKAWKAQKLTVAQVETWQRLNKYYFMEGK